MYFKILLFFIVLTTINLSAYELQRNYYIDTNSITIADIIEESHSNTKLFQINPDKHTKRVKAKELISLLQSYGYKNISSKYPYIQFNKKSPIDTSKIIKAVKHYYKKNYPNISISKVVVMPNSYLEKLPNEYKVKFKKNAYLSNKGIFHIKTYENKKLFFSYQIQAKTAVIVARQEIRKATELSKVNTQKKSIILEKFRAKPLFDIKKGLYQTKHKIKKSTIITQRDIVGLTLVKRGSYVTVTLYEPHISITFLAKALRSARLGESIYVMQKNGKKIEVVVTGKNKAEVK